MTPKEKARELFHKFYNQMNPDAPDCNLSINQCKECSIIVVDEIINQYNSGMFDYKILNEEEFDYWNEVKSNIQTL